MRTNFYIIVIVGLILAACAPAAGAPAAAPAATATTAPLPATEPAAALPTQAPATVAPAVAVTPRGDALEATDPRTVVIGAGQPVLVEFFAFW